MGIVRRRRKLRRRLSASSFCAFIRRGMIYGGPIRLPDFSEAAAVFCARIASSGGYRAGRILHLPRTPVGSRSDDPFPKGALEQEDLRAPCHRTADRRRMPRRPSTPHPRSATETPIIDWAGPMPIRAAIDVPAGSTEDLKWYWKGDFVKTLPDAAIDASRPCAPPTCQARFPVCTSIR